MAWSAKFDKPIQLARGKQLRTLSDARDYILKLPQSKQAEERWMAAAVDTLRSTLAQDGLEPLVIGMVEDTIRLLQEAKTNAPCKR